MKAPIIERRCNSAFKEGSRLAVTLRKIATSAVLAAYQHDLISAGLAGWMLARWMKRSAEPCADRPSDEQ